MIVRLGKDKRRVPKQRQRREILVKQRGKCFYCRGNFGDWYEHKGRPMLLKPVWDHLLPWCYSGNNEAGNFVASCRVCNGLKSGKVFDSIYEAKIYVQAQRVRKGYPVFGMWRRISAEAKLAEVLLREVPDEKLLEASQDSHVRAWKGLNQSDYYRLKLLGILPPRKCDWCGGEIETTRAWRRYCGKKCQMAAWCERHPRVYVKID